MFQTYRMELIKAALQGFLANKNVGINIARKAKETGIGGQTLLAREAIEVADAVIEELEKEGERPVEREDPYNFRF